MVRFVIKGVLWLKGKGFDLIIEVREGFFDKTVFCWVLGKSKREVCEGKRGEEERILGLLYLGNRKVYLRMGRYNGVEVGVVVRDIRLDFEGWIKVWIFSRSYGRFLVIIRKGKI